MDFKQLSPLGIRLRWQCILQSQPKGMYDGLFPLQRATIDNFSNTQWNGEQMISVCFHALCMYGPTLDFLTHSFSAIFGIFLQLKLSYAVDMFLTLPWPEDSLNLSQGNRDDFVNWISQSFLWKSVNQLSSKRGCDTYRELCAFTFLGLIISLWLAVITAVPPDWWIGSLWAKNF